MQAVQVGGRAAWCLVVAMEMEGGTQTRSLLESGASRTRWEDNYEPKCKVLRENIKVWLGRGGGGPS